MDKRLKGIDVSLYPDDTKLACFCKYCNKFIASGKIYHPKNSSDISRYGGHPSSTKTHVSMDAQKFRRCKGYTHKCASNPIKEGEFGDFWFELLLT